MLLKNVSITNFISLLCDYNVGHVNSKIMRKRWFALLLFRMSGFTEQA